MKLSAFDYALKLLALRDRTRREITDRLERKKYVAGEIAGAVAKLEEYGYIDDGKFARAYSTSRMAAGRSWRLARAELLKKGVTRETLDSLAEEIRPSEAEEVKSALGFIRRKLSASARDKKSADRIAGMLSRRGYSWAVVGKVLKETCKISAEETIEQ